TGRMRVTERIAVDLGFLGRHGIFRFWDLHDPNAPQQRREPTDVTVLRNGEPEEVDWSEESMGRYTVARIGSANRTVTGEHTYLISYTIDEVLLDEGDHSRFYWNLI